MDIFGGYELSKRKNLLISIKLDQNDWSKILLLSY